MTTDAFFDAAEATWPAARTQTIGPWTIRDGQGGGKRVSAATASGPVTAADIPVAEAAMRQLGQPPLFMIREGEEALDDLLDDAGYTVIDPVIIYAAPVATVATTPPPPVSAFTPWPPLKIMEELWVEGGIGPARLAVMARVKGPKTALFGRSLDHSAGVGFAAIHEKIAFCHALEVAKRARRQGTAVNMMRAAAFWAQDKGAQTLAVLVTQANTGARALYASLNMQSVGHYHYRIKQPKEA